MNHNNEGFSRILFFIFIFKKKERYIILAIEGSTSSSVMSNAFKKKL